MDADFQHKEPVLALRCSSLHAILKQADQHLSQSPSPSLPSHAQMTKSNALFSGLNQTLLTQAELAREAGRFQVEIRDVDCRRGVMDGIMDCRGGIMDYIGGTMDCRGGIMVLVEW